MNNPRDGMDKIINSISASGAACIYSSAILILLAVVWLCTDTRCRRLHYSEKLDSDLDTGIRSLSLSSMMFAFAGLERSPPMIAGRTRNPCDFPRAMGRLRRRTLSLGSIWSAIRAKHAFTRRETDIVAGVMQAMYAAVTRCICRG